MKIGRNFHDCLAGEYLSEDERRAVAESRLSVPDAVRLKRDAVHMDIVRQVRVAADLGLQHVELEQPSPGLFAACEAGDLFAARETAKIFGLSLSMHLAPGAARSFLQAPLSAESLAAFQRDMDAVKVLGCEDAVLCFDRGMLEELRALCTQPEEARTLQACAEYAFANNATLSVEVPVLGEAEMADLLGTMEESLRPLEAALRLSRVRDLAAFSGSYPWPSPFFHYVRLCPEAESRPEGLLLQRAEDWTADRLRDAVRHCQKREAGLFVVSGDVSDPEDLTDVRRLLVEEKRRLDLALEGLERGPFRLAARP
jgi:hypothetical protein